MIIIRDVGKVNCVGTGMEESARQSAQVCPNFLVMQQKRVGLVVW